MIVYDLICDVEHRFEAWFASADDFESQVDTPMLICPVCGSEAIARIPSGIHMSRHGRGEQGHQPAVDEQPEHLAAFPPPQILWQALRQLIDSTENVGREFPEQARRIHYGESPRRSIRGQASREEAEELRDEGIEVLSLPVPPSEELN
ncbi:MAG: DUF1178 family protein [Betaproteobacteria bacterium]